MTTRLSVTIDLNAVASNWQLLQQTLGASCECGAVVKANAYGLGMVEVAQRLSAAGCRSFFVANIQEGVSLRKALSQSAVGEAIIYVLQGVPLGDEDACVTYCLSPVLISDVMFRRWVEFVGGHGAAAPACVVKLNSGMNRLGLDTQELPYLLEAYPSFWRTHVKLLLSHMACADEPEHPLNPSQLAVFNDCVQLVRRVCPAIKMSLANSSAIFLGEPYRFDLARPGAALYGVNPTPGCENPMQPVVYLRLPVLQVRQTTAEGFAGYGAQSNLPANVNLAVVAGGYADGIFRSAFGHLFGVINGVKVPLVGRVSMDSLIFDVTGAGAVQEGAEIEILGDSIDVDVVAQAFGTIGYEILTGLGDRLRRSYIGVII